MLTKLQVVATVAGLGFSIVAAPGMAASKNAVTFDMVVSAGASACLGAASASVKITPLDGVEIMLEVAVQDDGVGFGAAASRGTGVGLVNVRRQLAARYKSEARLTLEAREPRGASATILIPLRAATESDPGRRREPTGVCGEL